MRLSIELTAEQHQHLKTVASFQGKSLKDYVLERVLPPTASADEAQALQALEAFLAPRIQAAAQESSTDMSATHIFEAVHREAR